MPPLELRNRRWIDEAPFDDELWLHVDAWPPDVREQLVAVLRLFEPTITEEQLDTLAYASMKGPLQSVSEAPIECWEVMEAGALRYRLWLAGDGGWLFDRDTTTRVDDAMITAFDFHGEGSADGAPGTLAVRLEEAQKLACADVPDASLRLVSFVSR